MTRQKPYGYVLLVVIFSLGIILTGLDSAYAADFVGKTVTSVRVTGNTAISESIILGAVKVKVGDVVTADKIKQDMQAIYELGTFFDVVSNFNEVPEGVQVVYTVMENPVLQDIVIKGNTKVSTDKLSSMLTVSKGNILNSKTLNDNVRTIEQYYHDQGYILSKVSDVSMGNGGVLTLTINEGMLEGIEVKGNEKTKSYVITREMKLKPNQPFNVKDAKRSMQKVYNLGYFEDVNMKLNPGKEPNSIVLETSVVEQKTASYSPGVNYSKADGLSGTITIRDSNFRGTGDKVSVNWEFGGKGNNKNYELSYTRPWLDTKQTSLEFNIYNMTSRYEDVEDSGTLRSTYDKKRQGFEVTLGRPQGEYAQNYITLKHRKDVFAKWVSGADYSKSTDPYIFEHPNYLQDNFGITRSISLMRVYDSRDNVFNPTEGKRISLTAEFAGGVLGGDFNFNKYTAETRNYFNVGHDHIIALQVMMGYADGNMPDSGRFQVGGDNILRGYRNDQFKGNKMFVTTAEYRFPIAKKVGGVIFTDIGNAWGNVGDNKEYNFNLKASVGLGLRIATPIGPIRLDYAKSSQGFRTHFGFGGKF